MEYVYFLLIGLAAGWIAAQLTKARGFGWIGNLVLGVLGAMIGGVLFSLLGLTATGIIGSLVTATCGAVLLIYGARYLARA